MMFRICDTTVGTVKDLSSGPRSPDMELMILPAIVPSFTECGRSGEYGLTLVRSLSMLREVYNNGLEIGSKCAQTRV